MGLLCYVGKKNKLMNDNQCFLVETSEWSSALQREVQSMFGHASDSLEVELQALICATQHAW